MIQTFSVNKLGLNRVGSLGSSSGGWSAFWAANLFNQSDLNLWTKSRSIDELVDDFGTNPNILTKVANVGATHYFWITPAHIYTTDSFAVEFYVNCAADHTKALVRQGIGTTAGPGYEIGRTWLRLASAAKQFVNVDPLINVTGQGWVHVFIFINRKGNIEVFRNGISVKTLDISADQGESITNAVAHTLFVGAGTNNAKIAYYRAYDFGATVDPDIVTNIGTYALWNYQNKDIHANLLSVCSGDYNFNGSMNYSYNTMTDDLSYGGYGAGTPVWTYDEEGSLYDLNYGTAFYRNYDSDTGVYLNKSFALLRNGNRRTTYAVGELTNYYLVKSILGISNKVNISDCKIRFADDYFDRSNATIWNADCRASDYYDAADIKAFHLTELNQRTLNSFLNDTYRGRFFVKFDSRVKDSNYYGSVEDYDRVSLKEVMFYNTDHKGIDNAKIVQYTGDTFAAVLSGSAFTYDAENYLKLGYFSTTKPMLVIRFDDGFSGYTYYKTLLDSYNVKGTINLTCGSDPITTLNGLPWATIVSWYAEGWEFYGSSLNDEDMEDPLLSPTEIDDIFVQTAALILSRTGIDIKHWTPNQMSNTNLAVREVARKYFNSCHAGAYTAYPEGANPLHVDKWNLAAMRCDGALAVYPYTFTEGAAGPGLVNDQLDICLAENRAAIIYMHSPTEAILTGLETVLVHAQTIGIPVVALDQLIANCKYL